MYEPSKYARLFDEDCYNWQNNREMNKFYMEAMQTYANDLLKYRGYVFLRDIYEKIGFKVSKDSITAGWHMSDTDHVSMQIILSDDVNDSSIIVEFRDVNEDITVYF